MTTNFFQTIASLNAPGMWTVGIHQDENGHFVVSALYAPNKSTEPLTKTILPLIHRGTAEDMDAGFFEATLKQVEAVQGLYSNIKAVTVSIDNAKKKLVSGGKSLPVKSKIGTDEHSGMEIPENKVSAEDKRKAYFDAIKQVVELNDNCKYEEALALLPSVSDYPEKAEELNKRRADLTRKKEQMSKALELFNQ